MEIHSVQLVKIEICTDFVAHILNNSKFLTLKFGKNFPRGLSRFVALYSTDERTDNLDLQTIEGEYSY